MEHFDPYLKEMETRHRMVEMQQWAANERLARRARAGTPSFASRVGIVIKHIAMLLRRLSGQRRTSHHHTVTSLAKLARDTLVSEGHEH